MSFYCRDARRYWSIIDREMARSDGPELPIQVNSSIVSESTASTVDVHLRPTIPGIVRGSLMRSYNSRGSYVPFQNHD